MQKWQPGSQQPPLPLSSCSFRLCLRILNIFGLIVSLFQVVDMFHESRDSVLFTDECLMTIISPST